MLQLVSFMNQSVTRKGIIFAYIKRLLFVFFSVIRMLLEEEETQIDRLVDNMIHTIINTEMIILAETMDKYCKCISNRMLAMEDATLREFTNLEKFSEAFIKGWEVWKRGEQEEAFKTVCETRSSN